MNRIDVVSFLLNWVITPLCMSRMLAAQPWVHLLQNTIHKEVHKEYGNCDCSVIQKTKRTTEYVLIS